MSHNFVFVENDGMPIDLNNPPSLSPDNLYTNNGPPIETALYSRPRPRPINNVATSYGSPHAFQQRSGHTPFFASQHVAPHGAYSARHVVSQGSPLNHIQISENGLHPAHYSGQHQRYETPLAAISQVDHHGMDMKVPFPPTHTQRQPTNLNVDTRDTAFATPTRQRTYGAAFATPNQGSAGSSMYPTSATRVSHREPPSQGVGNTGRPLVVPSNAPIQETVASKKVADPIYEALRPPTPLPNTREVSPPPTPPPNTRGHRQVEEVAPEPDTKLAPADVSTPARTGKENQPPNAPKKAKKKATGAGSKSGANRRGVGGSDDEVAKLSTQELASAKLKLPKAKEEAADDTKAKLEQDASKAKKEEVLKEEKLTDEDKDKIVEYITNDKRWDGFRAKQAIIYQAVGVHTRYHPFFSSHSHPTSDFSEGSPPSQPNHGQAGHKLLAASLAEVQSMQRARWAYRRG